MLKQLPRHDEVAAALAADLKGASSGVGEVVATIEADGALVVGVGAEEKAAAAHGLRIVDGGAHQSLPSAEVGDGQACVIDDG